MPKTTNAEDYFAICEVKSDYCRFLDGKNWTAYTDLFTEDYLLDTPRADDAPPIRGREAAVASVRSFVEHAQTTHQVHQPEIDIDGDSANVIWAMQDRVIWGDDAAAPKTEKSHVGYGQYHERYERKDGRWRIAALRLTYLIYDAEPR